MRHGIQQKFHQYVVTHVPDIDLHTSRQQGTRPGFWRPGQQFMQSLALQQMSPVEAQPQARLAGPHPGSPGWQPCVICADATPTASTPHTNIVSAITQHDAARTFRSLAPPVLPRLFMLFPQSEAAL